MEFRKIFDTIPDQFDKYRPRYSPELFEYLIDFAKITPDKKVLELGPGTGQATDPILKTGCDYNAIELGEHLYAKMKEKYAAADEQAKPQIAAAARCGLDAIDGREEALV